MRLILFILGGLTAYLVLQHLDSRDAARELRGDGSYAYTGYTIKPLEAFELTGRLLSTREYRSGREAELSPVDLVMGWGPMAEPANLAMVEIAQRNRWAYWQAQTMPMPRRQLESNMANIHIIPATAALATQLEGLEVGDDVTLVGELVQVNAEDGWRWRSSLSRTDTGEGSCELLWLTSMRVHSSELAGLLR